MSKEALEAAHDNIDIVTDVTLEKVKGRVKPAHLEACRKQRVSTVQVFAPIGKAVYEPSRFYTCEISNQILHALNPNEFYVVYKGEQIGQKGLPDDPSDVRTMKFSFLCAYRVREDAVELDNAMIPTTIEGSSICRHARDAPPMTPKLRRSIPVMIRR